ncbi:MAG: M20/M25/M40 family metallo-hydrolase [Acidobacteriota bacterium]
MHSGWLALILILQGLSPAPAHGSSPGPGDDTSHRQAVQGWVADHRQAVLDELMAFVSRRNVSGETDAMAENAAALRLLLEKRGLAAERWDSGGAPYLFARLPAEAASPPGKTLVVLFYAHFDGQPVDPARWTVGSPFTPTLVGRPAQRDARLYGRSAADDKGPIIALLSALDALRAVGLPPTVETRFILDPEEESGSPHLGTVLEQHAGALRADMLIFADGPVHPSGRPTVVFGTRGIITMRLTVYGPAEAVHSGHYGNWAPNPAEKLAALLASMKDADGHVRVAGFYDDVRPLSASERHALAAVPRIENRLQDRLLIARPDGAGRSLQELINLPSLNVRGLGSGWVGRQARTIVPATATAEIDLRLVPDVDPLEQVERIKAHARRQGFFVVEKEPGAAVRRAHSLVVRITHGPGTPAARTSMDTELSRTLVGAVRRAGTMEPVLLPTLGGTGPLSHFHKALGIPVYGVPIANHDDKQHAPDENLRLGNLWDGIVVYASLLRLRAPGED